MPFVNSLQNFRARKATYSYLTRHNIGNVAPAAVSAALGVAMANSKFTRRSF